MAPTGRLTASLSRLISCRSPLIGMMAGRGGGSVEASTAYPFGLLRRDSVDAYLCVYCNSLAASKPSGLEAGVRGCD